MVELGYSVLPEHRRQGHGHEIAATMWAYAAGHPDVRVLRATVSPTNTASIAIIEGAGLVHVGEQIDDEDGLELIYEISASDMRR
jgi:RimJ/RimL family protein N-acetyltransferase